MQEVSRILETTLHHLVVACLVFTRPPVAHDLAELETLPALATAEAHTYRHPFVAVLNIGALNEPHKHHTIRFSRA